MSAVIRLLAVFAVLGLASVSAAADMDWQQKAKRDLLAIRVAIEDSHPGVIDNENPGFRAWLYDGYFKALEMVQQVKDSGGYAAVLRFYVNGFHDVHLTLSFSGLAKPRTPGFLVKLEKGEYVVADRVRIEVHVPPMGSKLLSCDGRSANMLAHDILDPYFTVSQINAHRWFAAPYLFVDDGNPFVKLPKTCLFQVLDHTEKLDLQWNQISNASLTNAVNGILDWNPNLGVRQFGHNGYWVTVPSMAENYDHPQYVDLIDSLKAQALAIRAADVVVIDVRSNGGGFAAWGTAVASAIWGDDYVRHRAPDISLDTRVSATTVSAAEKPDWKKNQQGFAYLGGTDAQLASTLKEAYDRKVPWVSTPVYPLARPRWPVSQSPVKGKVVFLTDTWCVSACLMFADLVFDLGDVMHVGQPTNADTLYTGVRKQQLETSNATLTMPMQVFRRRKRAANQTYVPQYVFRGDITDTFALEQWITELTAPEPHAKLASSKAVPTPHKKTSRK